MASIAMLLHVGGAVVNALAFSGSNYMFSILKSSGLESERKRHDEAVEQLQAAHEKWTRRRAERLDWVNEELRRRGHAVKTFQDVDAAIKEYSEVTGLQEPVPLGLEPQLTDFYTPSAAQKDREIVIVVLG